MFRISKLKTKPHWLIAVMMVSTGCGLWPTGPSKSVGGNWTAPGIGHLGSYYELSLTQDGDTISGVMCHADAGLLVFEGVTVAGNYPRVTFAAQDETFSGTFEDNRDQIAGNFGSSHGATTVPLRFVRSATATGRCEGAKPLP